MAASAGTVTLELDANSVKLLRDLKKATNQTKRSANKMQRSMGRAFQNIKRSALAAGTALVAFGATRFAADVVQAGLSMERFERALKVATGSAAGAAREMKFIIATSKRLGVNLEETAGAYAKLAAAARGTALEGKDTRDIFLAITEAAVVLGLSAEQTGGALTAIEQIISKGKVSAEELRGQLGERLPGAFQIAARSIGVTTSELDKMLRMGEVLAEDLLPSLARELREAFGPQVEEASTSAQAAIARLSTSMFQLKVSIANSGLLDAVGELADGLSRIISPSLEQQIEDVRLKIEQLKSAGPIEVVNADALKRFRTELIELLKLQSREFNTVSRANPTKAILSIAKADQELTKFFEKQTKDLETLRDQFISTFETAEQEVERLLGDFDIVAAMFPEGEQERIRAAIKDVLTQGIEEIEIDSAGLRKKLEVAMKGMKKATEESSKAARELGLTFASAFEDAIVEGKKLREVMQGLLKDILRIAIRKTITEPLTDFFGGIFGGGKAHGGPVSAGTIYEVGEKGRELFMPGVSGTIIPNNKLAAAGGNNFNFNIDASGADADRVLAIVPPAIEQSVELAVGRMFELRAKGQF